MKKLVRKEKSPYALGPRPRGMMAWVTRLIRKAMKLVASLKKYRFLRESIMSGLLHEAPHFYPPVLGKMAIIGHPALLAVGRVLGGIHLNDQAPLVLPSQEGIGDSVRAPYKASNPMAREVILQPRESWKGRLRPHGHYQGPA